MIKAAQMHHVNITKNSQNPLRVCSYCILGGGGHLHKKVWPAGWQTNRPAGRTVNRGFVNYLNRQWNLYWGYFSVGYYKNDMLKLNFQEHFNFWVVTFFLHWVTNCVNYNTRLLFQRGVRWLIFFLNLGEGYKFLTLIYLFLHMK